MSVKNNSINEVWLILKYNPVSLFSLRMTHSTNKGGKTLLVPTPYAFKMTLIDVCFRVFNANEAEDKAKNIFDLIKRREIRFSPPVNCLVQNTFIKIRQEERDAPRGFFISTIAYREFCFFEGGPLSVAINIRDLSEAECSLLVRLGSHINCIGKRGSFWQYIEKTVIHGSLPSNEYTLPDNEDSITNAKYQWVHDLDDFGEILCKAKNGFDRISTYGTGTIKLGEHRILERTLVPYKFVQSSKHFTQFKKTC